MFPVLTIITKVFGNNGRLLPQSLFPLRYPKKNHPVFLYQLSSRLRQEPLYSPQSIINVGGLAGLQMLSRFSHLSESGWGASAHRPALGTVGRPHSDYRHAPHLGEGREPTDFLLPGALCFKNPLPESHVCQKPVGVSSLSNNVGQCQSYLPFPLFQLSCLAWRKSLQSHMHSSNPSLISVRGCPPITKGLISCLLG